MTAQTSTRPRKTATMGQTGPRPRWLTYPEAAELCTLSVRSLKRPHGGRYAALLRGRREGTAAEGIRRGGADRAGGPVPQLVTALRLRVGDDPKRQVGSTRSSFTVVARPSLSTSVRLASRARVLGGRSRRARVDRSMQRHYVDLKWEADRPGTSPLRRVRVDRLGPGAGYAPRGNRGLSRRHFPKF